MFIGPITFPRGNPEVTLMEEDVLPSRRNCVQNCLCVG